MVGRRRGFPDDSRPHLAAFFTENLWSVGADGWWVLQPPGARGLDEFEIHPALALGKERNATANQHRIDPGPVFLDQAERGRLGGERRAADRHGAFPRLGSQLLDLFRQAVGGQAGIALHADSVVENTTLGSGFQSAAHSSIASSSDGSWSAVSQKSIVS